MGCCSSKSSPEKAKDDEIAKQLKSDASQLENELKLLLLGMVQVCFFLSFYFGGNIQQKRAPQALVGKQSGK
jgi:hypothetical protein